MLGNFALGISPEMNQNSRGRGPRQSPKAVRNDTNSLTIKTSKNKKQYTDEYEDLLNTIEQENSQSQLNVGGGNRDLVTAD